MNYLMEDKKSYIGHRLVSKIQIMDFYVKNEVPGSPKIETYDGASLRVVSTPPWRSERQPKGEELKREWLELWKNITEYQNLKYNYLDKI
jgi:hypothetical protein